MKLLLHMFLWWWPELPGWVRYTVSGAVVASGVVAWICASEGWPAWILIMLVGGSMMMYGEPTDAEKRGYRL